MTESRILVIDFDGVLCDSTEECIVTAWNAWNKYNTKTCRVRAPAEVPESIQCALRINRSYVRTAGEYLILLEAARRGQKIDSQQDYDNLFNEFRPAIKLYGEVFFSVRDSLRSEDESHWLGLHTVFPEIPNDLQRLWEAYTVFVVTGKDSKSVQKFFDSFNLPISSSRIYDKDAAHDKLSAIRVIASSLCQPLSSVAFVDDNIHHLLPPHRAGCHVFMAGWGYHTSEQVQLARQHSIPILELETWAPVLLQRGGAV
jgi:phosphoglycolate phosphatase-like HAD superfamily hydrolase